MWRRIGNETSENKSSSRATRLYKRPKISNDFSQLFTAFNKVKSALSPNASCMTPMVEISAKLREITFLQGSWRLWKGEKQDTNFVFFLNIFWSCRVLDAWPSMKLVVRAVEPTLPPSGTQGHDTIKPPDLPPPVSGQVRHVLWRVHIPWLLCFPFLISYAQQENISEGQVETASVRGRGGAPPVVSLEENNERTRFPFVSPVMWSM